jgi:hypothetical protein
MVLARFAIHVIEFMFCAGLAGSAVVVLISFFEDAKELVGDDDDEHAQEAKSKVFMGSSLTAS